MCDFLLVPKSVHVCVLFVYLFLICVYIYLKRLFERQKGQEKIFLKPPIHWFYGSHLKIATTAAAESSQGQQP